jgi:hypothetical protein
MINYLVDLVKYFHHRGHRGAQGLLHPAVAIDHALYSVAEMENIEVDQQAHTNPAEAQIREQLGFVDRMDGLGRFHLDYDATFDNQIDAIPRFKFAAFIDQRQGYFSCYVKSVIPEIVREAGAW